jgi:acyl-CoA thioesterase FadM
MIVLFRLVGVIVFTLFRRRIEPLEESVITLRCWPNDLDLNFHMNSGRFVSMMDIGRISLLCRYRILRKVLKLGWRPIAGATMIRYRRSLHVFDRFQVRSRVVCWDEKWFYFEHIIEKDGQLCAIAHVRGLLRGPNGNVAPQELLAVAGQPALASPPMPEFLRLWNEAEALR